jgi:hypothetical protein
VQRTGPLSDRVKLAVQRRLMVGAWRMGERLGIDLAGATEGASYVPDAERGGVFDELIDAAVAGDGTLDGTSCPYPVHELLTHLVVERGWLLHGSNDVDLEALEARAARDYRTELLSVVACDDGIWPIFYAVLARRDGVANVFTACMHLGSPRRLRRFYMFVVFDADPRASDTWTRGAVYAFSRSGFRREWGNEWVSPGPVQPLVRVLVGPEDFPLRDVVLAATADDVGSINRRLRAAKRERAAATGSG